VRSHFRVLRARERQRTDDPASSGLSLRVFRVFRGWVFNREPRKTRKHRWAKTLLSLSRSSADHRLPRGRFNCRMDWKRGPAYRERCGLGVGLELTIFLSLPCPAYSLVWKLKARGYSKAKITAPSAISEPPASFATVSRSPRKSAAKRITRTTLSLSMGATFDAGPNCRARK
jgi:hypothetical protein